MFGLSDNILNEITKIFALFPTIQKAVVFGSRAKNTYKNYSDIDIAVYAPTMTNTEFSKLWSMLDNLDIIYKIDIIHFDMLKNVALKKKIERDGKILYSP